MLSADQGAQILTFLEGEAGTLDTGPRAALQFQMRAGSLCLHKILSVYVLCVSVSINWEAILKLYNLLLLRVEFMFTGCVLCFSQPAKCGDEANSNL